MGERPLARLLGHRLAGCGSAELDAISASEVQIWDSLHWMLFNLVVD